MNKIPSQKAMGSAMGAGSTPSMSDVIQKQMAAGKEVDANMIIQLKVMELLSGTADGDEMDVMGTGGRPGGVAKAMSSYRKLKEQINRWPERLIVQYISDVKARLGVEHGQMWTLLDWSKRIQWGKFRSFMRCHVMIGEAIRLLDNGKPTHAMAHLCQCQKALHQASIDGGSWKNAWLLTLMPDPLAPQQFGGAEQELEVIAAYTRAISDLQTKAWSIPVYQGPAYTPTGPLAEDAAAEEEPGKGGGKERKKGGRGGKRGGK
jgi:hypothetical protein